MVSGKPRCLNETKKRIVPEDLFRPSLEGAGHAYTRARATPSQGDYCSSTCRAGASWRTRLC
jgi:hypothetical protein